jgi:hypothetical protein
MNLIKLFWFYLILFVIILSQTAVAQDAKRDSTRASTEKRSDLVENIKDYSRKDNLFGKFFQKFFVFEKAEEKFDDSYSYQAFETYEGRSIKAVYIKVLDPLNTALRKSADTTKIFLGEFGNQIHLRTRKWIIRQNLLFSENHRVDPLEIAETERLLRKNRYIYDARIDIFPYNSSLDTVYINVAVQDVWSIRPGFSYNTNNDRGYFYIRDINFLGLGGEIYGEIKKDDRYEKGWEWEASYANSAFYKDYLTAYLYRDVELESRSKGFGGNRNFLSPLLNWIGGANFHWKEENVRFIQNGRFSERENIVYNQQDVWLGYSVSIRELKRDKVQEQNQALVFAGRVTRTKFTQKAVADTANYLQDDYLYLGSIGYSNRNYIKRKYVHAFGSTEDVPVGRLSTVNFGFQNREESDRVYLGFKTDYAYHDRTFGYLSYGLRAGAFRKINQWENGILDLNLFYFSKLLSYKHLKSRHFLFTRFSYTHNPFLASQLLDINNGSGLRGLDDEGFNGNKRWTLNYEANLHIPITFLGFRFALIGFADFAIIAPEHKSLSDSKVYQGYGIGIKIKNEHLVFDAIQLNFGIYPNLQDDYQLFVQDDVHFSFYKFREFRPNILTF